jgi:hypothetical protein
MQNGVKFSLKIKGEGFKSVGFLEIKLLQKNTPEPVLPPNKDPSGPQLQIAISL